jgi:hypothetical protein
MRINKILFSQVIRIFNISGLGGGEIYGLNLSKALESRYGNRFVIDRFQVYGNGILVEAKISTDECEAFLDDVTEWTRKEGGIEIDEKIQRTFYTSQIEAHLSAPLSDAFPKLNAFGQKISDCMRSYGHILPDLTLSGLTISSDAATAFRIEGREGSTPETKLYFCVAALRTSDHIRFLEEAETILFC